MFDEVILLPRKLVEEARRRGFNLEDAVLEALSKHLGLNPKDLAEARVELAQKYFAEAERLVDRDPGQASEKLYKVAEECVKALTMLLNIHEVLDRVRGKGRWSISDLDRAVRIIAGKMGEWILDAWDHAWVLHVWGFHELKLDSDSVKMRMKYIKRLMDETIKITSNKDRQ